MIKRFIFYPMGMKLVLLLLSNDKSVMRFSMFNTISYTTHIKLMTGEALLYQLLTSIMITLIMCKKLKLLKNFDK